MTSNDKIKRLRDIMAKQEIAACIIPSADPHLSEYPADHWTTRQWLSGFTGSAGTLVVTNSEAGLWTDSRYFLQADEQLQGSGIRLFRDGLPDTPSYACWLLDTLIEGDTIGIESEVFPASEVTRLQDFFSRKSISRDTSFAPYDQLWEDRPTLPTSPCFLLPETFSGKSATNKIEELLDSLRKEGCNATLIGSLDMIAWLFNLRGNDVAYNPVFLSYAYVSEQETVLFVNPEKITSDIYDYLASQGVLTAGYDQVADYLNRLSDNTRLLIAPGKLNYALRRAIPASCSIREIDIHPIDRLKAIKNETEIAGFREAMKKDGVALVRFRMWLEERMLAGERVTELDVMERLRSFRSEQELFFGESFGTIAGYGAHGAIVHYAANEQTNATLQAESFLLIDSGGQYFNGTTDITRTIALGEPPDAMRHDYTNVLKGMIALAQAQFPAGTCGNQLDILARQALWQAGENYGHGTGHGVGHFLNVHEGPQSIRMNYVPVALQPGMVTSNEPGIYRKDCYGIRIENLLLTVESEHPGFFAFETLTLCPIDTKAIAPELLSREETTWLNEYHQRVYDTLAPRLTDREKEWLRKATTSIYH